MMRQPILNIDQLVVVPSPDSVQRARRKFPLRACKKSKTEVGYDQKKCALRGLRPGHQLAHTRCLTASRPTRHRRPWRAAWQFRGRRCPRCSMVTLFDPSIPSSQFCSGEISRFWFTVHTGLSSPGLPGCLRGKGMGEARGGRGAEPDLPRVLSPTMI
jgi:hypothetical protein